jgi:GxxExxY protein
MSELICKDEVYAVVGAAIEVYNVMGSGFLEPVYQEVLEIELAARSIPFQSQVELVIRYKNRKLKQEYIPDFIAYGKVIVEIKALERLTPREEAQLLNYLKATGIEVGMLINFGSDRKLEWKRMVRTNPSAKNAN